MGGWSTRAGGVALLAVVVCATSACGNSDDSHTGMQDLSDAAAPDARVQEDSGHSLMVEFCSACHAAPLPAAHTAKEWPGVVARMLDTMGRGGKPLPTPGQVETILDYLQANARPA